MKTPSPLFIEILQSPLQRLTELRLEGNFEDDTQKNYLSILIHYLSSEPEALEKLLSTLNPKSEIAVIGKLRLQNMLQVFDEHQLRLIREIIHSDSLWNAEAAFALGMTYLRFKKNIEARDTFQMAYRKLTDIGAHKKAVKALLNIVVSESRMDNTKRLIQDYQVVANRAKSVECREVEGICYQNISKELQLLGFFDLALRYSHQAIDLQEAGADTVHYYETILQRCHVLIDLGRFREAHQDFARAKLSRHPQTIEALKIIENLLGAEADYKAVELEPAWISKLASLDVESLKPTKLEMDFIDLVKSERVSKDTVILKLYGEQLDWESARNRFKVFLNRFRKKYVNLVVEENGHFMLVDETVLTSVKLAQ
jgi:tetratricopeptide (TPR) repeat protein